MRNAWDGPSEALHGHGSIAGLRLDSYNLKLGGNGRFVGDEARGKAFQDILDSLRAERSRNGVDPLGSVPSSDRHALDALLEDGASSEAHLIREAVACFAHAFADVSRQFLRTEEWRGTQRIAVGGGFRENRIGEEAIRQAETWLKAAGFPVELRPIHSHPDEAALLGAVHLCPTALLHDGEAILAVDIGGSNIRAGVVLLNQDHASDLCASEVLMREHWCHKDEKPDRDETVERLTDMLRRLVEQATAADLRLVPFIGIGCPGEVRPDGTIVCGTQNLPGDWEADDFHLPERIRSALPTLGGSETVVVMHNDAVVQGLSELPYMRNVPRWGILTIGTGLGNARFSWSQAG